MSDESDNEEASAADPAEAGHVDIEVDVLPEHVSPLPVRGSAPPVRSRPPPKPSRPSLPSVSADGVRHSSIPLPRSSNPPPDVKLRSPNAAKSDKPTASSIKPMRMIALGVDRKRSEPPPAAVERT